MDKENRHKTDKIRFSIGAKLVTIVTLIVLVSLGSITALESWLMRQDLRISAEDSNFEANRRSAAEAEDPHQYSLRCPYADSYNHRSGSGVRSCT